MVKSPDKILVVDDDFAVSASLQVLLESEGYHVELASTGAEAIRYLDSHAVDLVLTDIHMPERDGIEVIIHVRETFPQTKIICMSGGMSLSGISFLKEAKMLGAHRTLKKPINPLHLLEYVSELLNADS